VTDARSFASFLSRRPFEIRSVDGDVEDPISRAVVINYITTGINSEFRSHAPVSFLLPRSIVVSRMRSSINFLVAAVGEILFHPPLHAYVSDHDYLISSKLGWSS